MSRPAKVFLATTTTAAAKRRLVGPLRHLVLLLLLRLGVYGFLHRMGFSGTMGGVVRSARGAGLRKEGCPLDALAVSFHSLWVSHSRVVLF